MNDIVFWGAISLSFELVLFLFYFILDRRRCWSLLPAVILVFIFVFVGLVVSSAEKFSEYTGVPARLFSLKECEENIEWMLNATQSVATLTAKVTAFASLVEIVVSILINAMKSL